MICSVFEGIFIATSPDLKSSTSFIHITRNTDLHSIEALKVQPRPCDPGDTGLISDLLWSDPDGSIIGWGENDRGVGFTFGPDIVTQFLTKENLSLVCRAHQVCKKN